MLDGFDPQVDVEFGPVEMAGGGFLYIEDLSDWGIFKPRKVVERHKKLLLSHQQPDAMA